MITFCTGGLGTSRRPGSYGPAGNPRSGSASCTNSQRARPPQAPRMCGQLAFGNSGTGEAPDFHAGMASHALRIETIRVPLGDTLHLSFENRRGPG